MDQLRATCQETVLNSVHYVDTVRQVSWLHQDAESDEDEIYDGVSTPKNDVDSEPLYDSDWDPFDGVDFYSDPSFDSRGPMEDCDHCCQ